ncbi:hypothetical protein HID58_067254, partial [Brassica napus]
ASHLAVPKHQRPPFWTEEAVGFHKRVKRIHDPMKIGFHALCLKLNLLFHLIEASHLAVPKHQRPPFWTEEAVGFHKRVKRIHDPMKIVVPCAVFEAESPIPPDRSMQYSSYIGIA